MNLKEKLCEIQAQMKAPKNLTNKFGGYNYRNCEGICEAFKPYEVEYKVMMFLEDEIVMVGDRYYVQAVATIKDCESDEWVATKALAREPEEKKGMDAAQVTGATSSYARKYALNALFLLDDTKDPDTEEYAKQTGSAPKEEKKPIPTEKKESAPTIPIESIKDILTKRGIKDETIIKLYKVESLDALTNEQKENILKNIDKIVKKQEENK